jgi:hypothetical protein
MNHLIACPECNKNLQVPEELIGKSVQCPECKHTFAAALPEAPPPMPTPEPPRTSPKPAWDKKKTRAGAAKTTRKRRDDDDDDDEDDEEDADDDDPDDYDDDRRRSRRGRRHEVPGKITGIAVMSLIGGIIALLWFFVVSASSGGLCCVWPGTYYSLVVGILAIVKGASLFGASAQSQTPPISVGVMLIINIINLDVINVVLGILILVFCSDEEVTTYLAR